MGFVQSASASNDATATSIAVAFGSNVASGNLICVQVAAAPTTDQVTGVTDTVSTAYTERRFLAGANVSGSVWSGVTTVAGANTVTAAISPTEVFRRIAVHEVSGFSTFDSSNATRFAAGACGNSGDITPAVNGCYVFGCMHADQGGDFTIAAGTNVAWTLRQNYQHANAPAATEDFIQTAAAAINAQFVEGSCTLWRIYYVMAFQPSTGRGGGKGPPIRMRGPRIRLYAPFPSPRRNYATPSIAAAFTGTAALDVTQAMVTLAASGTEQDQLTGTAALAVTQPVLAATGTETYTGTAALAVVQPVVVASGTVSISITGTATLGVPTPQLSGIGTGPPSGQGGRPKRYVVRASRRPVVHRYPARRQRFDPADLTVSELHSGAAAVGVSDPRIRGRGFVSTRAEATAEDRFLIHVALEDRDLELAVAVADLWMS